MTTHNEENAVPSSPSVIDDHGVEEETIGGEIHAPFDPEKIDINTKTLTIDLAMSRLRHRDIDLQPDFQRQAGIWTSTKQSQLIESMLLKIPLPLFYASEDEQERWAIVDGIQRLSTIARFIEPSLVESEPLRLSGLEYLTDFEGKVFDDLPARLKRRLHETEILLHVIRHTTPEEVKFNIFGRLNTGGEPLTMQELRHALTPGIARSYLKELAEGDAFQEATARSVPGRRMADREMVLRYIAFSQDAPESYTNKDFNEFLRQAMKQINGLTNEQREEIRASLERAMQCARDIFANDAFRKRYKAGAGRSPINKALFEAIAVNLARFDDDQQTRLVERKEPVQSRFQDLMNTYEFNNAVSQGTGDPRKVRYRFEQIRLMFEQVLT